MPGIHQPTLLLSLPSSPHFTGEELRPGENKGLGCGLCHLYRSWKPMHGILIWISCSEECTAPSLIHVCCLLGLCHLHMSFTYRNMLKAFLKIWNAIKKIQLILQRKAMIFLQVAVIDVLLCAECWSLLFCSSSLQPLLVFVLYPHITMTWAARMVCFSGYGFYC